MSDANGRKEKRTPVTLKIKFKSATLDQFIERYSVDVSHGGIFIRTKDPLSVGTQLRFEFQLQDASPLISGEGTVVWTREFDPSRVGVAPGMGVRFDRLAADSQQVLDKILAQKNQSAGQEPRFDMPIQPDKGITKVVPPQMASSLQAAARPTLATKPAPGAVPEGKPKGIGALAPAKGGFPEEGSRDATPLPNPMPFHAVGEDDFTDDVFDQPTKVASLENLLKHEEEQARAAKEGKDKDANGASAAATAAAAAKLAQAGGPITDEEDQDLTNVVAKPVKPTPAAASSSPAGVKSDVPSAADMPMVSDATATEPLPRRVQTAPLPVEKPPVAATVPPMAVAAAPKPAAVAAATAKPVAPPQKKSGGAGIVLGVAVVAALGAAAAVYFLVIRNKGDDSALAPVTKADTPPVAPAPPTDPGGSSPEQLLAAKGPDAAPAAPPKPKGLEVEVTSTPPGATVEVDGAAAPAPTPTKLAGLEPDKKYKVVVKLACYKDETVEVTAKADAKPVDVKLKALDRVLHVQSEPKGAQILVDGKASGTAPADVKLTGKLDPKAPHKIAFKLKGFEDAETTVAPDAACTTQGEVAQVDVTQTLKARPVETAVKTPKVKPPKDPATAKDTPPKDQGGGEPPKDQASGAKDTAKDPPKDAPKDAPKDQPADAPKPKQDCDPSPDAPDWARCK